MIPKRIVLDTNVCLDLFVFNDPRWAALLTALKNGAVEAVTKAECRMEWQIVLGYSQLHLNEAMRAECNAAFDAMIECIAPEPLTNLKLPLCSDPDDQKFLELSRDAQATTLITKDKALLKLAKKTARAGLFEIILPQAWALET